jgi:hypothetical protein
MTLATSRGPDRARPNMRPQGRPHDDPDIMVPIVRSGILAREFCRDAAHAEVAAVFERSLYLRREDMFVCLGEPAIDNGPLTLIADVGASRPLSALGFCPGEPASISDRCITIGCSARFTFERCELWRPPRWPLPRSFVELADVGHAIARLSAIEAPEEGFGRLYCRHESGAAETPLTRIARQRIARFTFWLRGALEAHHVPQSSQPIQHLIGLGPGLTPSGDDFLTGALALLDALAERKAHAALAHAIAVAPRGLTSALSDCLLRAAAAGHVSENLCCAVSAVIADEADKAVAAIRKIGHSSGWDMMAGIVTALAVVATARLRTSVGRHPD